MQRKKGGDNIDALLFTTLRLSHEYPERLSVEHKERETVFTTKKARWVKGDFSLTKKMWFKRPKLQLSIAWIVVIIASILSISSGISYVNFLHKIEVNWLRVLVIPVVVIGTLLIITLQTLPYIFKSILHKIKIKLKDPSAKIGFILACIFIGFLILSIFISQQKKK